MPMDGAAPSAAISQRKRVSAGDHLDGVTKEPADGVEKQPEAVCRGSVNLIGPPAQAIAAGDALTLSGLL